jgi:hypothetical protein
MKTKNYEDSEKPLPTLIKEKDPLWDPVTLLHQTNRKKINGVRRVAGLT